MKRQMIIQWLLLAATAVLLVILKWLYLGVTNYNIFLLILVGWILLLVIAFRALTAERRTEK